MESLCVQSVESHVVVVDPALELDRELVPVRVVVIVVVFFLEALLSM